MNNDKVEGLSVDIQEKFGLAMRNFDPTPQDRRDHFAWLERNQFIRTENMKFIGWDATISEGERISDGAFIVKIRIRPRLYPATRSPVLDFVEETYSFSNGKIKLIDSDAREPKPDRHAFPSIR